MRRAFPLLLMLPAVASAMQLTLTRPQLCDLSHRVVFAEVTDLETVWTGDSNGGIERHAFVTVTDTVKGQSANSLVVNLPGGQIGETGHWVEDVPNLMVNGRYLLFLAPDMDGKLTVIGGEQGAVRITKQGAKIGETLESATTSVEVCRVR